MSEALRFLRRNGAFSAFQTPEFALQSIFGEPDVSDLIIDSVTEPFQGQNRQLVISVSDGMCSSRHHGCIRRNIPDDH